jgi:hypothetical protein
MNSPDETLNIISPSQSPILTMHSINSLFSSEDSYESSYSQYTDPLLNDTPKPEEPLTLSSVFIPDFHHLKTLVLMPFIQGMFYGYGICYLTVKVRRRIRTWSYLESLGI